MTSAGPNLNLEALERELLGAVAGAPNLNALEQIRVAALGKKGRVSELMSRLANERADVTLPVRPGPLAEGRIHPVAQVLDECIEIFADMGFAVAEGPDIETDDLNFTKLNVPPEHPARQEHDTFYFLSLIHISEPTRPY